MSKNRKNLVHVEYKTGKSVSRMKEYWEKEKGCHGGHSSHGGFLTVAYKFSKNAKDFGK